MQDWEFGTSGASRMHQHDWQHHHEAIRSRRFYTIEQRRSKLAERRRIKHWFNHFARSTIDQNLRLIRQFIRRWVPDGAASTPHAPGIRDYAYGRDERVRAECREWPRRGKTTMSSSFPPPPEGPIPGLLWQLEQELLRSSDSHALRERLTKLLPELTEAFRELGESIPIFIWTARADGSVDYMNARWATFTGRSPEDALGDGWTIVVHPDDVKRARTAWERAVTEGTPFTSEYRIRRENGSYVWHLARAEPRLNARGQVLRWIGATTDVHDRKRVEAVARRQGRWLETVLQSVGDGLIATGPAGDVRLINSVAQELTGWAPGDAVGRPLKEVFRLVDEATRRPVECPGTVALREGRVVGITEPAVLLARDGTERSIDDSGAPIRGDDGSLVGGVLCFRDVTVRRRADAARARLAAIVESSDDAIIGEDLAGTIVSWNEGARQIYGYTAEEAIGKSVRMLVPTELLGETESLMAAVRRGEHVRNIETRRVRKDQSQLDVSLSISPIRDRRGHVIGMSKIARDITEWKRAEETIRRSEMQLRLALEAARMAAWIWDIRNDQVNYLASDRSLFDIEAGTYKRDELTPWNHPEDAEMMYGLLEQAKKDRTPYSVEYRLLLPDGTVRWVLTCGRYKFNEAGEAVELLGVTADVTERRAAEDAFRESEHRYRLLYETMVQGVCYQDADGKVVDINPAAERILGAKVGDVMGKTHFDCEQHCVREDGSVFPREENPSTVSLRTGKIIRDVLMGIRRPAGTGVRWINITAIPLFRPGDDKPSQVCTLLEDITERKQALESLKARDEQLRLALEAGRMAAWERDLVSNRVTLSVTDESVFGDKPGTYDHTELLQRVHPDDVTFVEREFDRALRDKEPLSFEVRHMLPSGRLRWVITQGRYLYNEAGEAIRLLGVSMDVTKRKTTEEALRQSEQQFRAVFLASRDGIVIVDDEGRYAEANPAAGKLFGVPADELVGRAVAEFMEPGFDLSAAWEQFRREGGRRGFIRLVQPSGEIREVEDAATANFMPGRHMAILHDVTDRNRAELALRRYADRLASLREIDRAILTLRTPEEVATIALLRLGNLVTCWRGSVWLMDMESLEGRIVAAIGAATADMPTGSSHSLSELGEAGNGMIERLMTGEPIVIPDLLEVAAPSKPIRVVRDAGGRSGVFAPLSVRGKLIGLINLMSDRTNDYSAEDIEIIKEGADQVAIALENARLYEENRTARARLELLSRRLIRAQEDERRQIARELHDEIGQALTAVNLNLQAAKKEPRTRTAQLDDCISIVDTSLQLVRGMALDLRPSLLDDLGLVAALQWYVERHARRTGMEGRFVADPENIRESPEVETACFRLVQEALTNIARHARATRFSVELSQHNGGLELIIRDNGSGFNPAESLDRAVRGSSLGLLGMVERAELVGGKVRFVSAAGEGTEVQASFPVTRPSGSSGAEHMEVQ